MSSPLLTKISQRREEDCTVELARAVGCNYARIKQGQEMKVQQTWRESNSMVLLNCCWQPLKVSSQPSPSCANYMHCIRNSQCNN
eukprot:scaffold3481_cov124-Skeletonema_marinoi.AAC.7